MTPDVLRFTVPGEPVPKGRARTFMQGGRVISTTPPKTRAYESRVRWLCKVAASGSHWVFAEGDRFALMVRVFRTHEGAGGDLDNVIKAVSDAVNGVAFADDRYIRAISGVLTQDAAAPRVEVEVHRLRSPQDAPGVPVGQKRSRTRPTKTSLTNHRENKGSQNGC